ncbi:hypothetical protein KK083_14815 [Fulvivirgaceae bacterium PWU4]|uniref:Uncharacterized protein n=1 Tax=Chryseosolibacter histidini TaxID=2782349 RepID=A0AAP2DN53_9BACT|nr:hypothetical protein [Chryseosolibacter histidini]MBT1698162.1 hypothetical protein [Chryseosolibacter histidini]
MFKMLAGPLKLVSVDIWHRRNPDKLVQILFGGSSISYVCPVATQVAHNLSNNMVTGMGGMEALKRSLKDRETLTYYGVRGPEKMAVDHLIYRGYFFVSSCTLGKNPKAFYTEVCQSSLLNDLQ